MMVDPLLQVTLGSMEVPNSHLDYMFRVVEVAAGSVDTLHCYLMISYFPVQRQGLAVNIAIFLKSSVVQLTIEPLT